MSGIATSSRKGRAGPRGARGPAGEGRIQWKGQWLSGRVYDRNDAVHYRGNAYICVKPHSSSEPPSEYWDLMATAGKDGAHGKDGQSGAKGEQGIQGKPGSCGGKGDQGPKGDGFTFRGAWTFSAQYEPRDCVAYQGSTYICTRSHTNQMPSNISYWHVMVTKGDTGGRGLQGDKGEKGDAGRDGISFVWRGYWSVDVDYIVNDTIGHRGNCYICIRSHKGQSPPNEMYWQTLVSKGDTGERGLTSLNGFTMPGGELVYLSTLKYVPTFHNRITLNGETLEFGELEIDVPGKPDTTYDVFLKKDFTFHLAAWPGLKIRPKTASEGLYIGTVRTDANGEIQDNAKQRFVWNAYNRKSKFIRGSKVEVVVGAKSVLQLGDFHEIEPGYHEFGNLEEELNGVLHL